MVVKRTDYKLSLSSLVSYQNYDGSWTPRDIAAIMGVTEDQLVATKYVARLFLSYMYLLIQNLPSCFYLFIFILVSTWV
jgi:hypothetical protein